LYFNFLNEKADNNLNLIDETEINYNFKPRSNFTPNPCRIFLHLFCAGWSKNFFHLYIFWKVYDNNQNGDDINGKVNARQIRESSDTNENANTDDQKVLFYLLRNLLHTHTRLVFEYNCEKKKVRNFERLRFYLKLNYLKIDIQKI